METQRPSTWLISLGLMLFIVLMAVVFYATSPRDKSVTTTGFDTNVSLPAKSNQLPVVSLTPSSTPETISVDAQWNKYANSAFKFSLHVPKEFSEAREYEESGGAMSATFQNPATGKGFQIYVTPYAEDYITPERLRLDVPSGVVEDQVEVIIDGVRATLFSSKNSIMGQTKELWFINEGFLYEIVIYKDLEEQFSEIMQTWQFE